MCEERDEGSHMSFSREFIAQLGQLTFDFLSDTWAKDLELFARHAKRTSVNVDDVKLLVRNNPSLLAALTEESDAIMAAATVQKEQSAKRRQTKRDEGEEREERASPSRDVPTTSAFQQPPPTTAALPDLAEDDSLDGIDWDAFDQPIAANPSDNRSLTKCGDSSAKAGDDDLDNFDSDVDEDFQRPSTSTSRPAHLDSTRLSVTNSKVSKTALRDRSPSPVADTSLVHSNTERDFSSVKRSTTKGAAAKNAAESAPKRRSESKGRNTSGTAPKKAKRSTDNNRSTAGNSTAYDSFDDDDDFV
uniref:Centromere protein S n=1 Tax=Plectus sambesii TaxID=2011161 RepID=A0A914VLZ0_9BILA